MTEQALHLELTPPLGANSAADASVSINSLGAIDNLQIAATSPARQEILRAAEGGAETQELVTLSAGIGGAAIAQAPGPLKRVMAPSLAEQARKLEVRAEGRSGVLVLKQP